MASFIQLVTVVVRDYDEAIAFYSGLLGFDLVEDSPSETNDGRPKRWVVVRPPGAETGLLLAQADGEAQVAAVGNQTGGRVGFFLRVDDFDATFEQLTAAGVEIVRGPFDQPYGKVCVFADISGNNWDLLGPEPEARHADLTDPTDRNDALAALSTVQYVALTTFRKSGVGVATAVWVAVAGDDALVITEDNTGKTKRLARDPRVTMRPCDIRGRVTDDAPTWAGTAVVVRDHDGVNRVKRAIGAKYLSARLGYLLDRVTGGRLRRTPRAGIVITLT